MISLLIMLSMMKYTKPSTSSQKTVEQIEVIQEVVSPEVTTLI